MSKLNRLFKLIQIFRRHRYPVSAQALSDELNVSVRTLYRDIQVLKAQGADIEGEPGLGYVLRPSFMLPPLMFNQDELEALVLGSRWVAKKTDKTLRDAAENALAKIASVLTEDLRNQLELSSLLIGPGPIVDTNDDVMKAVRKAIRLEYKIDIDYSDEVGRKTQRVIWPIGIGFFEQVKVMMAWCELRSSFRHFRVDRIQSCKTLEIRYPTRKNILMDRWRKENNISTDKI